MSEINDNQGQEPKRRWFAVDIDDDVKAAIIFLCIAAALFLAFGGFFTWHTVRMRSFELEHVRMYGTVVDVVVRHSTSSDHRSSTSYYYVISYTYGDNDYEFIDGEGHGFDAYGNIGKRAQIFVDPKNPDSAEMVASSDFVSIICAMFFAFFCATYAAGMNILLKEKGGSSFIKRLLCVWGAEILLGVAVLLLFWLGLPNSGFGEVFTRIDGAVGIIVVLGLVVTVIGIDGIITSVNRNYPR